MEKKARARKPRKQPYTVRARKGRPGYQADVWVGASRLRRQFADREDAKTWAAEQHAKAQSQKGVARPDASAYTFGEICGMYLSSARPELAPRTFEYYHERLIKASEVLGLIKIGQLRRAHVAEYIDRRSADVSTASAAKDLQCIQRVIRYAVEHDIIEASGVLALKKPRFTRLRPVQHFTWDEIEAMANNARGWKFRGMILLAGHAGLRRREIEHFHRDWVDEDTGLITVPCDQRFTPKSRRSRIVPMSVLLEQWMEAWLKGREYLLDGDRNIEQVRRAFERATRFIAGVTYTQVRLAKEAAKKDPEHCKPIVFARPVTPHALRHSYASNLAAAGVEGPVIQALLGHVSMTTTSIYLRATAGYLDRARAALPGGSLALPVPP